MDTITEDKNFNQQVDKAALAHIVDKLAEAGIYPVIENNQVIGYDFAEIDSKAIAQQVATYYRFLIAAASL